MRSIARSNCSRRCVRHRYRSDARARGQGPSFSERTARGVGEQAVPQFFDATRVAPFAANVVAIAIWVPIVEESLCRGLGFALLEAWGERVAIVGSAVAFALAHGAVLDLPWVLVTGLGLGYLRPRTGGLYPSIALPAPVNGIPGRAPAYLA